MTVPLDSQLPLSGIEDLLERAEIDLVFYDDSFKYHESLISDSRWHYVKMNEDDETEDSRIRHWKSLTVFNEEKEKTVPRKPKETAVILYTSGTTGKSKGVCLSQKNILTIIEDSVKLILIEKSNKVLSILPINHAYELHCGIFPILSVGGAVAINDSLRNLSANLNLFKPTSLFVVPLIAEMFYQKIWNQAEQNKKDETLRKIIRINNGFKKINLDLSIIFFKQIRESFGGELKRIVCGGAMLNSKIAKGFSDLGVLFSEGYGITECAPLVSVNPEKAVKFGSLGKTLDRCRVKILDGEILVEGDMVMNGYYKDELVTEESFLKIDEKRCFKTGDLGRLDSEGY